MSMLGKKHSEETKRKMSEAQKGEKNHMWGKGEDRRAEKNSNWKGGVKTDKDGRVYIYVGYDHSMANNRGYVYEYRLIMSEILGRPLSPEEVVHHINGDPSDNRKENLMFFPSNGKHLTYHEKLKTERYCG